MWSIWLVLAGFFLIGEIFTVSFLLFWPGIGAILALITSFFTSNLLTQIIVFTVSSTLMIIFMKPLLKKFVKEKNETKLNVDSLIGKKGIVIKEIDNIESKGQVKVNGELWSAFSSTPENIKEGKTVVIEEVKGVKLKVREI